jgi:hypothetical protein
MTKAAPQASSAADLRRLLETLTGQEAQLDVELPALAVQVLVSSSGLGYSQLNELLLLLGFDRVSYAFFQFLVDGGTEYQDGASFRSFDQLEAGIERFRQIGLLHGNIKHAFKTLTVDAEALRVQLELLSPVPPERFAARHDPISPIKPIPPDQTYYLGYIIKRELQQRLKANPDDPDAKREEQQRRDIVQIGKGNHEAYLRLCQ